LLFLKSKKSYRGSGGGGKGIIPLGGVPLISPVRTSIVNASPLCTISSSCCLVGCLVEHPATKIATNTHAARMVTFLSLYGR
jgi:hypothetical protein